VRNVDDFLPDYIMPHLKNSTLQILRSVTLTWW